MLVSKFDPVKFPWANPANHITFVNPLQSGIDPVLAGRLAAFAKYKSRKFQVTRGHVTTKEQEATLRNLLKKHPTYYRKANGGVYALVNGDEKCMGAAPGTSPHESGLAVDDASAWFTAVKNEELRPFGLIKPMTYEPWHVQLLETRGLLGPSLAKLAPISFPIQTKAFQLQNGLISDDINGPTTMSTAKKVYHV